MKAKLTLKGQLIIEPETEIEYYALNQWIDNLRTMTERYGVIDENIKIEKPTRED